MSLINDALRKARQAASEHEELLLRRWYEGLSTHGVSGYDWEDCLGDFRWASIAGLQTTVFGAAFSRRSDRGEEMFVRMLRGQLDLIERLGAADLLLP